MKASRLAALALVASIGSAAVAQTAMAQAKTREQVRAELIQAQHDGIVPFNKTQYPPSPETIAQKKELHAVTQHAGEKSPGVDQHDSVASR